MDGRLIGGRHVAAALLGPGRFGEVWAATDDHGHWVALRLLDTGATDMDSVNAAVERVRSVWPILASLTHPNLVRARDLASDAEGCVLVSDFVEGGDLRSRLSCAGTIEPEQVALWGGQIAGALGALHAAGLTHGDLRLENVLIDAETGRVAVSDAALAPAVTGEPVSPEDDLYRLGTVICELACGRAPFDIQSPGTTGHAPRLFAVPTRAPGIPDALWEVVVALLTGEETSAVTAQTRLTTAAAEVRGEPAAPLPSSRPESAEMSAEDAADEARTQRWRRRVVVAGAVAVTGALLGGGMAAASLFRGSNTPAGVPTSTSQTVEVRPDSAGASHAPDER